MSRKRTLKKLQKRQESAWERLEELYLRGADDEFLALANEEIRDPAGSLLAAEWAEVAGRVLRQSLSRADLGRLERLLPSLRRGGPLLPEMALAEAVLDLAAGRLEAARSRIAGLALEGRAGGETEACPRDLLTALQSLAQDRPDSRWPLDDPYIQAAVQLFHALQSLEAQAFAPSPAAREDLARCLEAVKAAALPSETGDLHRLLDSAGRCLSLLADLDALDEKLGHLPESDRSSASQVVVSWLRGPGPLLAATLTVTGPALLAPLQHTVRLRWRAVLERVAGREGAQGLAVLWTAASRLVAEDVSLPHDPAALRDLAQAQQLLATGRHEDLARLLRSHSRTVKNPGELAALWSLELWAIERIQAEDGTEPPPHRAVVRLQQIAGEIRQRLPTEHRIEAARALRNMLFGLCRRTRFCEHMAGAALSLLEHLPDDAGLFIAGIAGAVASEDSKALRALEVRGVHGVAVQAKDLETVRRLMIEITREDPWSLAPILELVRPLFASDTWPEIAALVAHEMVGTFAWSLREESLEDDEEDIWLTRSALDSLRPMLAGTPDFAGIEVSLDCWQARPKAVEKRIAKFLADVPGLDAPLAAFRMLDRTLLPGAPKGRAMALSRLAPAVIERLDGRWQLWSRSVLSLAMSAERSDRQRLEQKLRELLSSQDLAAGGRETLMEALQMIQELNSLQRGPARPRPSKRTPRARRSTRPQLRLDL